MIILNFVVLIVGFVALVKGADMFVDGSASLARKFHVPSLIIGLTIVALGTSAPELAVSTTAAFQHSNDIALSNVIGSNMFNLLCVLGICALFSPIPGSMEVIKRDFPISIAATLLVFVLGGGLALGMASKGEVVGTISRLDGAIILAIFLAYMFMLIQNARKNPVKEENTNEVISLKKCIFFMILGIALIVGGGQAVVASAKEIAYTFGMSETLVGLTIVAVGTSLPELVTSIVAARKHENGLAMGNVVGSNLFNIMFILGTTAVINPVSVSYELSFNLIFLVLISILSYVFLLTKREVSRPEGAIMTLIYIAQVVFSVVG